MVLCNITLVPPLRSCTGPAREAGLSTVTWRGTCHLIRKGKVTCFLSITYHWPQLAVKLPLTHCTQKCKQFVPLYNIDMLFTQMPLKIKTLFFDVLHRSGNVLTYKCMCLHHQPNLITSTYYHILITRLFWFPCSSISIFINRINAILLTDISVCHQK